MKLSKSLKLFLGELQAECFDILLSLGEATVKDILDIFKKKGKKYAYTTILSEMQNLEKKGLVKSRRSGKQNIYFPLLTKEQFLSEKVEKFLVPILEEYPELIAVNFVKRSKLSEKEKEKLLQILFKK
jgi:predicted transcriptional regulator